MGVCDEVLKQGIFDTIIIDSSKSVSENLIEWMKSSDYGTIDNKKGGGLKIGFPIEGVPVEIGGDYDESDYNQWKTAVSNGTAREFTSNEELAIVKSSVSEVLVNAWLQCIRDTNGAGGTGIVCNVLSEDDAETILFRAQFIPNSPVDADRIPKVEEFTVTGATSTTGIKVGDEIPFSGDIATIVRDGRSKVTIVLDTEKGSCSKVVPEIPVPDPVIPPVNVEGVFKSAEGNRYSFEQNGTSIIVKEFDVNSQLIARGAGQLVDRTVTLAYESLLDNETGEAKITLSQDGSVMRGTYKNHLTNQEFLINWTRI